MGYYISDRQILASAMERSLYRPVAPAAEGCERVDETLSPGHPMYASLCDVFTLTGKAACQTEVPVFPSGCTTLVFSEYGEERNGWLCGAQTEIRKVTLRPGERYLVMRFMPGSNMAFLQCEASALTDRCEPADLAIRGGDRLMQIAERDVDVGLKAVLMSRVLRERSFERESDYLIRACTEHILTSGGQIQVAELAQRAGFSERYIDKIFERYIGLSPKVYTQIIQLQASLGSVLSTAGGRTLLETAVDNGYFDHTHMNRAYRRFLHCPAGALRRRGTAAINMEDVKPLLD